MNLSSKPKEATNRFVLETGDTVIGKTKGPRLSHADCGDGYFVGGKVTHQGSMPMSM